MNSAAILIVLKLIDILTFAWKVAPEVKEEYRKVRDKVEQMVREQRDPTPKEWEQLNAETERLTKLILGESDDSESTDKPEK